jgi:hypothetical protein
MNCFFCDKELDVGNSDVPPKWYGEYENSKLLKVVCKECIGKKVGKEPWTSFSKKRTEGGIKGKTINMSKVDEVSVN